MGLVRRHGFATGALESTPQAIDVEGGACPDPLLGGLSRLAPKLLKIEIGEGFAFAPRDGGGLGLLIVTEF